MYVFIGATDLLRSAVTEQQEYAASLEISIDALHKVGCSSSSFGFLISRNFEQCNSNVSFKPSVHR